MINYQRMRANLVMTAISTTPRSVTQIARLVGLSEAETYDALAYLESFNLIYKIRYKRTYHYASEYDLNIGRLK